MRRGLAPAGPWVVAATIVLLGSGTVRAADWEIAPTPDAAMEHARGPQAPSSATRGDRVRIDLDAAGQPMPCPPSTPSPGVAPLEPAPQAARVTAALAAAR